MGANRFLSIASRITMSSLAYRATLLYIKGVGEKTPLPFPFYALYLLSRPNAILRSCMVKTWASMGSSMGKKVVKN